MAHTCRNVSVGSKYTAFPDDINKGSYQPFICIDICEICEKVTLIAVKELFEMEPMVLVWLQTGCNNLFHC